MSDAELQAVYSSFTAFGAGQSGSAEMDSAKFTKLARESGLLDKKFTTTDLDLIFTRAKGSGLKRLDYNTFTLAVRFIAEKKGCGYDAVVGKIVSAGGPSVGAATVPDAVAFHDNKDLYTGVHGKGGPTTIDNVVTLSNLADRSSADVRGIKTGEVTEHLAALNVASSPTRRESSNTVSPRKASAATSTSTSPGPRPASPARQSVSTTPAAAAAAAAAANGSGDGLEERVSAVFVAFCSSVAKQCYECDSAKFFKLCSDCGLVDSKLSRTQCDLIFTRAASQKRMSYEAFRQGAVRMIAEQKGTSEGVVLAQIAASRGVSTSGTIADNVRFHDDKSTYTGVHTAGGPTTNDGTITLCNLADRSGADVRGTKYVEASALPSTKPITPMPAMSSPKAIRQPSLSQSPSSSSNTGSDSRRKSSGIGMGIAPAPPSPRRESGAASGGTRRTSLGTAGGTIAGSANKSGGVYDRLCNTSSYTGVYAERFKPSAQGGRINGDTINVGPTGFNGSTNSGGDHIVRDISQICRR